MSAPWRHGRARRRWQEAESARLRAAIAAEMQETVEAEVARRVQEKRHAWIAEAIHVGTGGPLMLLSQQLTQLLQSNQKMSMTWSHMQEEQQKQTAEQQRTTRMVFQALKRVNGVLAESWGGSWRRQLLQVPRNFETFTTRLKTPSCKLTVHEALPVS